jgi:ribonuclease P protein component
MPGRPPRPRPLPRPVSSDDFERALKTHRQAASAHFALHHVDAQPASGPARTERLPGQKLSTIQVKPSAHPVEDSPGIGIAAAPTWIGAVVPKRHARRAVTRSLIKRQIYAAAERHRDRLAPGLWIVRLRAPFDRARFASAASAALRRAARSELDALLTVAAPPSP